MPKMVDIDAEFMKSIEPNLGETKKAPHMMIKALAGTGKTSTLIEWTKLHVGQKPTITPSDQQKAIWDCLSLTPTGASVRLVAFNKSIAEELAERMPKVDYVDATTCHSFGNRVVKSAYGYTKCSKWVDKDRIYDSFDLPIDELKDKKAQSVMCIEELVGMVKCNLCGWDVKSNILLPFTEVHKWHKIFDQLCDVYDIDCQAQEEEIYSHTIVVLKMALNPAKDKRMTFDDMVWLPVVQNLTIPKVDLVLGDEMQDFNRMQQELVMRMGHRVCVVGDENQAIYGFAGADIGGVARLESELKATSRGLQVLPMTVTRRCSKAVVREARKYVKEFEAHESNKEGQVLTRQYLPANIPDQTQDPNWYAPMVEVGDRVICRSNAPLVGAAFMLIKLNKRVQILGRSIGKGLIKLIGEMKATTIPELMHNLGEWQTLSVAKEKAKRIPNETKIQGWQDRIDCIDFFCSNVTSSGPEGIQQVIDKITEMFDDTEKHQTVIMSSVHKAKGLEAERVFILKPSTGRKPKKPWQVHEERCIGWVSVTRAIDTLVYVTYPEKKKMTSEEWSIGE